MFCNKFLEEIYYKYSVFGEFASYYEKWENNTIGLLKALCVNFYGQTFVRFRRKSMKTPLGKYMYLKNSVTSNTTNLENNKYGNTKTLFSQITCKALEIQICNFSSMDNTLV